MIEVGHLTHEKEKKDEERGTVFCSVDHACTGRVEEGGCSKSLRRVWRPWQRLGQKASLNPRGRPRGLKTK